MQSTIQKKSYGSVKIFWLNKELLKSNLKQAADKVKKDNPEVKEVALFGSLAKNKATAFSDADILIIVAASNKRFIDRPDDFRDYFSEVGAGVDLFVYTQDEIARGLPFARMALAHSERLSG